MKKKIISLVAVAALAITTVVGTTLAYFTDKDKAVNSFTMGKVDIVLHEADRVGNKDEAYREVLSAKTMTPIVVPENGDYTRASNFIDKIVTVENKSTMEAYVRVIIAVPVIDGADKGPMDADNWLGWVVNAEDGWHWGTELTGAKPEAAADWNHSEVVEINGKTYRLYTVTNVEPIAPATETAPTLKGIYLNSAVDCDRTESGYNYFIENGTERINLGDISKLDIYVSAQAVQIQGFEDAWEAFEKSGLPANPWAK